MTVKEALKKHKGESIIIDFFWEYACEECGKKWLEYDEEVSFCGDKDNIINVFYDNPVIIL